MFKKIMLLIGVVLFCINWSNDPYVNTTVCSAPNTQEFPQMVSDGFDGAIIAWQDYRTGNYNIYAQHLDSSGKALWTANGIAICTAAGDQRNVQVVSDGSGGAIITWEDRRSGNYDIYAQRVDANGAKRWTANGVAICTAANNQENPQIVSDGSGGAIICWQDLRDGSDWDIYAQRIDSSGSLRWTADGEPVCTAASDQDQQQLVTDGANGAVITWKDERSSSGDIYAQRISSAGVSQWGIDGVSVSPGSYPQSRPQLAPAGSGGAVIIWAENRYFYTRYCYIYAQRLDGSGLRRWAQGGVPITSQYGYEPTGLNIIPDGGGGFYVAWIDHGCSVQTLVEVRRLNSAGTSQWLRSPSDWSDREHSLQLISDGSRGIVATWARYTYGGNTYIYAQRMNSSGEKKWGNAGLRVCSRAGLKGGLQLVPYNSGGAIITWHEGDIYAQNVCHTGGLGGCIYPIAAMNDFRFGGIVPAQIEFDGSSSYDPDGTITQYLWNFGDGKTSYARIVTHTYNKTGTYWASLRVRDNTNLWSAEARAMVKIFSLDALEAIMDVNPQKIKAYGKGMAQINADCREKQTDPDHEERPIPVNLGLDFSNSAGSWDDDLIFGFGIYSRNLVSGPPGSAVVQAVLEGQVMAATTIEFTWPLPPVNLQVELKANRSLFRGEYYAYLSWAANPDEVFTVEKYRIYRSTNGGSMELVAEVDAGTLTYVDPHLPLGSQYAYALSMVDIEGDESALSETAAATK